MDLQSIMGYANNSPYRNNPYLDIKTPEGLINMANTSIDLFGIDNMGNTKRMKAGRKKPYKFQGNVVREIPMQQGGNTPIYTSNPNDPRLRAYQDSLTLYNTGKRAFKDLEKEKSSLGVSYTFNQEWQNRDYNQIANQAAARLTKYNKRAPQPFTTSDAVNVYQDSKVIGQTYANFFEKPVQPVVYQKPKRVVAKAQLIPDEMEDMNLSVQGRTSPNVDVNKVITTPFFRTYRKDDGSQGTQYYPTFESFQEGTKGKSYINQQIAGDKSSARMTGYQTGGIFTSQDQITQANQFARDLLARQNAPQFLAANSVVARKVGDPVPRFEYPNGQIAAPENLARTLPYGVSVNDVENTADGYGYFHPQNGNFVRVDPNIYNQRRQPQVSTPINSVARAFQMGGRNPYSRIIDFLFEDESQYDSPESTKENKITAPSVEEVEQKQLQQMTNVDNDAAMQIATGEYNRNPYMQRPTRSQPQATDRGDKAQYSYQYYINKGLPPHVAAGIVGNLIQESGNFRDDVIAGTRKGDSGLATGIAQWHPDRFGKLKKWAASTGRNPYELETQLDFVLEEPGEGERALKALSKTTNSVEAANTFARIYERPKIIDPNRGRYARNLYPH